MHSRKCYLSPNYFVYLIPSTKPTRGKSLLELWAMYHFSSQLTATLDLCSINLKLLVHVLYQCRQCSCYFEVNQTKIKGGCKSGRKVVPHDSKSDLPLVTALIVFVCCAIFSQNQQLYTVLQCLIPDLSRIKKKAKTADSNGFSTYFYYLTK